VSLDLGFGLCGIPDLEDGKVKRKINVKLLRKIAKHISEEPKRLAMSDWVQKLGQKDWLGLETSEVFDSNYALACQTHEFAKCGTAACIGGWALLFHGKRATDRADSTQRRAGKLIGIDKDQSERLFFVESWPDKFCGRYKNAKTPRGKASAAVARIEHFIKTKGAE